MVKEPPSVIGARAELAVATGLVRDGYDVFTLFFSAHSRIDLVPIHHAPLRACHLRLEPAKNNQSSKIRWAADYLIGPP